MEAMSRRALFGLFVGPLVFGAIPASRKMQIHAVGEMDGWIVKIALESNRAIVAHHGPTSNGHTYPAEAWAQAVMRSIPICVEGEALPVGWATDFRVDVLRQGGYVVSCVPVLIDRCANQMAQHTHAGRPVFLTPTGVGQIRNGVIEQYKLRQFNLNHASGFDYASPLAA